MATLPPTSLFVRLDSRLRQGLQQQIYASIRRAILDRVVAPGARLPSSRALAVDLGVSRTTTLLAVQQLQAEGYLTARRGSGTFVAAELPGRSACSGAASRRPKARHPALSRRGAAVVASPHGAERLGGPPRAFRLGTPAVDLFPLQRVVATGESTPAVGDRRAAGLRRPGGLPPAARGDRRPTSRRRAGHAATPSRC